MLKAWMITDSYILLPNFVPSALVVMRTTIVGSHHPPQAINAQGTSHLTCRHSPARFSYIPASGGSGMQISPPDTVTNSPFGVVLQQGWRGGSRVSVHRQKTRQGFDRPMARWRPPWG